MGNMPDILTDWTEPEKWVWQQIAAGEWADLYEYDSAHANRTPDSEEDWGEHCRLSSKFIETILTQKKFCEATPYGGVRIRGAFIDDAPLDLEHARLQHLFWLVKSRILVDVKCRNLRVDGGLSFNDSFVAANVELNQSHIRESLSLMSSTFEGDVSLNSATVSGSAFLDSGAIFKGKLSLGSANIDGNLMMYGSTFEGLVTLTECTVTGVFLLAYSENKSAYWKDSASLILRNTHVGTLQDWWQDKKANAWPKTYQLEGFTYNRLGVWGEERSRHAEPTCKLLYRVAKG